jgi:hypothetical protein
VSSTRSEPLRLHPRNAHRHPGTSGIANRRVDAVAMAWLSPIDKETHVEPKSTKDARHRCVHRLRSSASGQRPNQLSTSSARVGRRLSGYVDVNKQPNDRN